MADFPTRLKELRIQNVKSQKDLADILNVSQNAIYNWENGKREPSLDMLKKIADYFEVSFDYLMGFEDHRVFTPMDCMRGLPYIYDYLGIDCRYVPNTESKMIYFFRKLNDEGQEKALDHVEMLTKIPDYQKEEDSDQDPEEE
jgi:transcriptional regulator with XRE-family HTH domain